jgi:hypothetical protein
MPDPPELPAELRILGSWRLVQADPALDFAPGAGMVFLPSGRLDYHFEVGNHRQRVAMVYRVEENILHTEVPETAHQQSAPFSFGPGDVLAFDFAGRRALFIREI